ncbi:hypothetical protein BDW67DRAFT_157151 [Aspergillus spinulosporus]
MLSMSFTTSSGTLLFSSSISRPTSFFLLRMFLVALPHSAIATGMAHQPPAEHPPGSILSQHRHGNQLHTIVGQNIIMDTDTIPSKITEVEGDLFDAPDGTALIHACNCLGSWGAGIAGVFRKKYPAAYEVYESHCRMYLQKPQYRNINPPDNVAGGGQIPPRNIRLPEGSTLVIPPQKRDYEKPGSKKHWIICLFTSRGYGRNVSNIDIILQNTELAIADLKDQLDELKQKWSGPDDADIKGLRACRFNSGLFGVDWALTRRILEDSGLEVIVVRPPGEK